jgi:hypothetical protein
MPWDGTAGRTLASSPPTAFLALLPATRYSGLRADLGKYLHLYNTARLTQGRIP